MPTSESLTLQAQLALVAYGNYADAVANPGNRAKLKEALIDGGLTDGQADEFIADGWTVKDTFSDAVTGANATVFLRQLNGEPPQTYLAIGGTVPGAADLFADGLLALGVPSGLNPQFVALRDKVQAWVDAGTLTPGFTVSGHSLGGYLAAAIQGSFSSAGEAFTYNAPAVGGVFGSIGEFFTDAFGFHPNYTAGVYNVQSSEGPSVVAGLGYDYGQKIVVQTDLAGGGHSMAALADGLSLSARLQQLLGVSLELGNSMADASGLNVGSVPEGAVDALRRLAYGQNSARVGDSRDAFHAALSDPGLAVLSGSSVVNLAGLSASQMVSLAARQDSSGAAARRALAVLSSFGTSNGIAIPAYADHPPEYWQKRADMLERLTWFNLNEKSAYDTAVVHAPDNEPFQNESTLYVDAGTAFTVQQGQLFNNTAVTYFGDDADNSFSGRGIADYLFGGSGEDTLYGEGGDDTLQGGAAVDHLYGGADNDTLAGGLGDDQLDGGEGKDTYMVGAGEGNDVLKSGGGIDVAQLSGGTVTFAREGLDVIAQIASADGDPSKDASLRVLDWFTPGTTDGMVSSVVANGRIYSAAEITAGVLTVHGSAESETILGVAGYSDVIFGNGGNDIIEVSQDSEVAALDVVHGGTGDDQIDNGAGRAELYGDAGNDQINGGAGALLVDGGDGADYLYSFGATTLKGGYGEDSIFAMGDGSTVQGDADNDYLGAYASDVQVFGGAGSDVLFNAGSTNTFYGGAETDFINDYGSDAIFGWQVGDGMDYVQSAGIGAKVRFAGDGISSLRAAREGSNLVLSTQDGEGVTFTDWFNGSSQMSVEAPDGYVWSADAIRQRFGDQPPALTSTVAAGQATTAYWMSGAPVVFGSDFANADIQVSLAYHDYTWPEHYDLKFQDGQGTAFTIEGWSQGNVSSVTLPDGTTFTPEELNAMLHPATYRTNYDHVYNQYDWRSVVAALGPAYGYIQGEPWIGASMAGQQTGLYQGTPEPSHGIRRYTATIPSYSAVSGGYHYDDGIGAYVQTQRMITASATVTFDFWGAQFALVDAASSYSDVQMFRRQLVNEITGAYEYVVYEDEVIPLFGGEFQVISTTTDNSSYHDDPILTTVRSANLTELLYQAGEFEPTVDSFTLYGTAAGTSSAVLEPPLDEAAGLISGFRFLSSEPSGHASAPLPGVNGDSLQRASNAFEFRLLA